MSLPSLKLAFEKTTTTSLSSSNDNSSKNIVNLILPPTGFENLFSPQAEIYTPPSSPASRPTSKHFPAPEAYSSPAFECVENEFKSQLLSFTIDILLNDGDLVKNIAERGPKVIYHISQLKQLIAILFLSKGDRPNFQSLIDIETEPIIINTCLCKNCESPFFLKIKSITINKSINFMLTAYATNMTSVFRISLEYAIKDK